MSESTGRFKRRILVIDDNRSVHDEMRRILCGNEEVNGGTEMTAVVSDDVCQRTAESMYEVDSAYRGTEGLAKVTEGLRHNRRYAVAFVANVMRDDWDGLETITRLWQEDPELEIVICTSSSDSWTANPEQLSAKGQLLILRKPLERAEVTYLVSSLMEKWNAARQFECRMRQMERSLIDRTTSIEQSHQETDSLLTAISSLLIGVDERGVVHRWNKSAEDLFRIPASEAVGKTIGELCIEWAEPEAANRFFNAYRSGAITRRAVLKLVRDGSTRVLGASTYPVTTNGVNRGFLCLGTDITKQCQLEQQLRQAQKLEAVGQLAAGVAHEINTPMQYLGDNLDFLQNKMKKLQGVMENFEAFLKVAEQPGKEGELLAEMKANLRKFKLKSFLGQVSEAINDSRDGVQHVSRIVRAMKEFAHPGQEEKTPVDVNRALESTIAVSTNEWKYVAEIETNLDASIPLVPALAGEINQVFLNILVNAAHAVGDTNDGGANGKGKITVSTRNAGDHVEVSIADSGGGIPDEIKERIFDPFFTTKEVGKGTGQGLAIAHSAVVNKHGGRLRCDSSPGVGTTFLIHLPVEANEKEAVDELASAAVCE